jgi:hypothetical protein
MGMPKFVSNIGRRLWSPNHPVYLLTGNMLARSVGQMNQCNCQCHHRRSLCIPASPPLFFSGGHPGENPNTFLRVALAWAVEAALHTNAAADVGDAHQVGHQRLHGHQAMQPAVFAKGKKGNLGAWGSIGWEGKKGKNNFSHILIHFVRRL